MLCVCIGECDVCGLRGCLCCHGVPGLGEEDLRQGDCHWIIEGLHACKTRSSSEDTVSAQGDTEM